MARKEASGSSDAHGWNEILGIIMVAAALLLVAALFSYDRYDLASNRVPPNAQVHNWIGPIGAHLAYGIFLVFGGGALLLPVFLVMFSLAGFFEAFAYLRTRWIWAVILLLACMGTMDLYSEELNWANINGEAGKAGGLIGMGVGRFSATSGGPERRSSS